MITFINLLIRLNFQFFIKTQDAYCGSYASSTTLTGKELGKQVTTVLARAPMYLILQTLHREESTHYTHPIMNPQIVVSIVTATP